MVGTDAASGPQNAPRNLAQNSQQDARAWTVRALLAWMVPFLTEREVDSPRAVAEILLTSVLGVERLRLYMEPERELAPEQLARLRELVQRAGRHEPVQYLVGRWPFLGRDFEVAPCTLIPRPCTEVLVERALAWVRERAERDASATSIEALDIGTGTGCIAISLALGMRAILRPDGAGCRPLRAGDAASRGASAAAVTPSGPLRVARDISRDISHDGAVDVTAESAADAGAETPVEVGVGKPAFRMVATDIVAEAIELAARNAARLGAEIDFRPGDMFAPIPDDERFDLIVSNPPYVTDAEYEELDRNVREFEPASALRGGADGLAFVRTVVAGAERRLRSGGLLLVEIGWKHGDAVRKLEGRSAWSAIEVLRDADGHERVLVAHRA
ncbi:MAG: peptide chain release factor N(5)-glutamine methyltransferase [Planctomycetaceae bacterium]|nr:peptide chain release factor N(5)-glutamine methyltransferase [Planctomycetaceae bacterium]